MIDGGKRTRDGRSATISNRKRPHLAGETEMDQSYYHGEQIKKVDKNMMFIANGIFTSCDLDHPHYFFFSPRMRVTVQDKIVADRFTLRCRRSGFSFCRLGFSQPGGAAFGYYCSLIRDDAKPRKVHQPPCYYDAISDYTDLAVAGDWYPEGAGGLVKFSFMRRVRFQRCVNG